VDKKDIVWIILVAVITAVVVSFMVPLWVKGPDPGNGEGPPPREDMAGMPPPPGQQGPSAFPSPGNEPSRYLKTAVSFINIGLIVPLFMIYAGIYLRLRSSFTLGLMAVIFALGMYALTSNPLIVSLLGGKTGQIGVYQIIPDLCATISLVVLVRISLE
jgi:tellurite resistance protein TehA-like permease